MSAKSKTAKKIRIKPVAKVSANTVLLYVTFAVCALCCGNVFDGALSFGLFVGALYCANPFISALLYLAASAAYGLQSVIYAGVRTGVMLLFVIIHKLAKKKIRKWHLLLYLIAANIFYCAYGTADWFALFDKLLFTLLGGAFSFVCIYVFRAVFVRGLAYPPALDEIICIALFAVAVGYGASRVSLWGLDVLYFFIPISLLFCCSVLGDKATLIAAVMLGAGNLLAVGSADCCAFCVLAAVAAIAAARLNRYVAGLSVVVVDVLMSYFFNLHGKFDTLVFIPTLCSVVVFFAVPTGVYNYLKDCVCGSSEKYLGKSVVKKLSMYTAQKLYRLSDIFLSMKNAFLTMSAAATTAEQAQATIVRSCGETVCKNCTEYNRCWRQTPKETEQGLLSLAECSVKKGKCTILDVPQSISVKCSRVSTLLAEVNVQTQNYLDYADRAEQVNNGKLLLGEQLGGVSQLLNQLAGDCKGRISYNSDKEKELVERLIFHNVLCCGAVVMEQNGAVSAIATVAQKDADAGVIEQVVSKLLGVSMVVEKVENTESNSWVNVYLGAKPRYTVTFGVAAMQKEGSEVSGDTHSVLKTDNGKCIFALCDGMGSGARAEQMSATAIGLVENFYRAGFDSDTILSCVNHLLVGSGNEVFCAVDICVLDIANGLTDFIKLGAPVGLIKCKGEVEVVSGSSLPMGVLDEMKPSVTKKALAEGDVVVLMSDGVTDCFKDPDALSDVLSEISCTNPQSVAELLLNKAFKRAGNKATDDMTVVAVKLS
ncbi:MAG: SpoIIE family protein phosphatase [Corallococcus sp.]|nr:SpoIIE family protein phosphatase [Corallococcus sp.]MCM1359635.1 SpoIIE family protein phosphatase [Corallococcus sp.]MCM1395227.1 SpoIIE family protein phosphatase [Corallococcus sp.]